MIIPIEELARRICVADHPFRTTAHVPVPCGTHIQQARNVYGLVTPAGTSAFMVVRQARAEAGLLIDVPLTFAKIEEGNPA